ncbi:MAG TPA: histidine kinase [Lysobacter sp.]
MLALLVAGAVHAGGSQAVPVQGPTQGALSASATRTNTRTKSCEPAAKGAATGDPGRNAAAAGAPAADPRAFWQTAGFGAGGIALALLAGLYLLRRHRITWAMQRELELEHAERERIARELHDTLLQSVQGLVLRFQSAAEQVAGDAPARTALEAVLDRADQVVAEARDRVAELRVPVVDGDLQGLLSDFARELAADRPVDVRSVQEGQPRPLRPPVLEQALAIGREALFNAFQHSRAGTVEVELAYDRDQFRLRVRDDGIGIDADTLAGDARGGQWGLRGMWARAQAIGGKLRLWSAAGAGTEIELAVPAALAYPPMARPGFLDALRATLGLGR